MQLSQDQLDEAKRRAAHQYEEYTDQGYTVNDVISEAEANIRYYGELLAQAEALLDHAVKA